MIQPTSNRPDPLIADTCAIRLPRTHRNFQALRHFRHFIRLIGCPRKPRILWALLLAVFLAPASPVAAAPFEAFPTGPVSWAKPLPGKDLRVLFVVPRGAQWDITALSERMALETETVSTWDATHLGNDPALPETHLPGTSEEEVLSRLTQALARKWDVIVLGNLLNTMLPETAKQAIAAHVAGGGGVLLAHPHEGPAALFPALFPAAQAVDAPYLFRSDTAHVTPGESDAPSWLHTLQAGDGRIAIIAPEGEIPAYHCIVPFPQREAGSDNVYLENQFSILCRCLLWLDQREPNTWIRRLENLSPDGASDEMIPPELTDEFVDATRYPNLVSVLRPFGMLLSAKTDQQYQLHVRVRRPGLPDLPEFREEAPIQTGLDAIALDLFVGNGPFFIDAVLLNAKGVVDWYTEAVDLRSWCKFSTPQFSKKVLLPNDSLEIRTEMPEVLFAGAFGMFYARALDWQGRVLSETRVPIDHKGGPLKTSLHFAELETPLVKIEIYSIAGLTGQPTLVDLQRSYGTYHFFPVRNTTPTPRPYVGTRITALTEFAAQDVTGKIREAFRTTELAAAATVPNTLNSAVQSLRLWPILSETSLVSVAGGKVRVPCLSDQAYQQKFVAESRGPVTALSAGSSLRYFVGYGECLNTTEEPICASPTCHEHYRARLQEHYGSLEDLNKVFGASFERWDAILPPSSMSANTRIPWALFRASMDRVFSEHIDTLGSNLRQIDGQARFGLATRAPATSYTGYDWNRLARASDFLTVPAEPLALRRVQAGQSPDSLNAVQLPAFRHQSPDHTLPWAAWLGVLHGIPGIWMEDTVATATAATPDALLDGSGTLTSAATHLSQALSAIQGGSGQLLLHATPVQAKLGLLENAVSRYASTVDTPEALHVEKCNAAWDQLAAHLGVALDFIPSEPGDSLDTANHRAIVLPGVQWISGDTLMRLLTFVEEGGLLLAEALPRLQSEFTPEDAARFTALFGCLPTGMPNWEVVPAARTFTSRPELHTGQTTHYADTALHVAHPEGQAETIPRWWLQPAGEGKALLLNSPLSEWLSQNALPTTAYLANLMAEVEVAPRIDYAFEEAPGTIRRYEYQFGDALLSAVLRAPGNGKEESRVVLQNPDELHVYDVVQGLYLGKRKKIRLDLPAGGCQVLTLLPYEVDALDILVDTTTAASGKRGFAAQIQTRKDSPGKHLFRVECFESGQSKPYYQAVLEANQGRLNASFPAPAGIPGEEKFRLLLRDTLTGKETQYLSEGALEAGRRGVNSFGGTGY